MVGGGGGGREKIFLYLVEFVLIDKVCLLTAYHRSHLLQCGLLLCFYRNSPTSRMCGVLEFYCGSSTHLDVSHIPVW